jgi:RNA polymerase sigma-70 factor, ECF subfamily
MQFNNIYKTYWNKIFRLCMGYVNDHELAKDLAQETFITVWEKLAQFKSEASIGTWIFKIAVNKCLRQLETQKRLPKSELKYDLEMPKVETMDAKVEFLYKCISELPETDRIIISLELENLKQSEIAIIVGISESNVRVKIHRIKEKLTEKFKHYEY